MTEPSSGRITGSPWRAIPLTLLTDHRRLNVSASAMWTLVTLLLAASRDGSSEWQSRDHLRLSLPTLDTDGLDELVRVGFVSEDPDGGLAIPADDWEPWTAGRPPADPTRNERQRRYRERHRAVTGNGTAAPLATESQHNELKALAGYHKLDRAAMAALREEHTDKAKSSDFTQDDYWAMRAAIEAVAVA